MPGLEKEDISIDIDGRLLSIEGHRKSENKERRYSESIRISDGIAQDSIKAEYKNGVLSLNIPKKKIEKKTKKITVK